MADNTWHRWAHIFMLLGVVATASAYEGPSFDRGSCKSKIMKLQSQANFTQNTPEFFLQDLNSGLLSNGPDNMTVTITGCYEFCGPWTFYWDAIPRLTTWVLPVLLLLSNIELSPIDKKRFMTIIHALGDPIDSFWSLIHKIYIWHRLYEIGLKKSERPRTGDEMTVEDRARTIACVLAGFEEISGARIESENYYHMITRQLGRLGEPNEDATKFEEWRRTARILADARTNEFLRTCLAIFIYVFGLIAAFIPEVGGGNTSPPGGRIGSAVFLSWLVPLALLSNTVGAFTSRRTCLTIMRQFVWATTRPAGINGTDKRGANMIATATQGESQDITIISNSTDVRSYHQEYVSQAPSVDGKGNNTTTWQAKFGLNNPEDDRIGLIDKSSWNNYFESLQWLGSIYTYRPWKVLYLDIDHRTHAHRKNVMMAVGGVFPVVVSVIGAFAIMWYAVPTGFSCRHIWVMGIFVLWIMSAIFTSTVYVRYRKRLTGHKLWLIILFKDFIVGLSSIFVILMSTGGIFNNCWCWSAYMMRRQAAYVPLNTGNEYLDKANGVYSVVVGVCLGIHALFYAGLMWWWWHGVSLVRWTESQRRNEWEHEMEEDVEYTNKNFLLFWYQWGHLEKEEQERLGRHRSYSIAHGRNF